jgi:hypothetical protein
MGKPMATARRKKKLAVYHAIVHITRVEKWCVEAESAEQARELLAAGEGFRCDSGAFAHSEVIRLEDD